MLRSRVSLTDLTEPGSLFDGKYLVERELGRGGMGSVLLARHPELGTQVALKVMLPELATDERLVERFLREGRATARLTSEHVARVFDAGRHPAGFPYLVMEFLSGQTLHERLGRGGPLPIPLAVDLLIQACEGIAHAHAAGIVHRDLKPANLFLVPRPDGSVCLKVLDFGIAKDVGGANPMTATAESFGSPEYMSPEQIRAARDVDPRSDVWSLGVVLFEALTCRVPFASASVFEVASMILGQDPAPLAPLRPDAPPELGAAIARCLQKNPDRRFPSVAQLAMALAPCGGADAEAAAARVAQTVGLGGQALFLVPAPDGVSPLSPTERSGPRTTGRTRRRVAAATMGLLGLSVLALGVSAWGFHTSRQASPASATLDATSASPSTPPPPPTATLAPSQPSPTAPSAVAPPATADSARTAPAPKPTPSLARPARAAASASASPAAPSAPVPSSKPGIGRHGE